jgi:SAM-dependent methyltransferase
VSFEPDFRGSLRGSDDTNEEYGRFQQHLVLVEDYQRVSRFGDAIREAGRGGGTVLDVGAGTGVLSLLALRSGFDHAVLVEPSRKIAAYADHLLRLNGLRERATIVNCGVEALERHWTPEPVDLVVSETISSVIIGFETWEHFQGLRDLVKPGGTMVPFAGVLRGCLATEDLATRNDGNAGIAFLRSRGVEVDLYRRAFRSGGNTHGQTLRDRGILENPADVFEVLRFGFRDTPLVDDGGRVHAVREPGRYTGIVLFWDIQLSEQRPGIRLSSLDPALTSWHPYYIPFSRPLDLGAGNEVHLRLRTRPLDHPYRNAFQLTNGDEPVTEVLYW